MNKRAIELSINFIVLFILAIAMFSVGLVLVRNIFFEADEMKRTLDDRTRQKINTLLLGGNSWNAEEVVHDGGPYVEGAIFAADFFEGNPSDQYLQFLDL